MYITSRICSKCLQLTQFEHNLCPMSNVEEKVSKMKIYLQRKVIPCQSVQTDKSDSSD